MKKIAILLIALMVISIGFLSGCTEENNKGEVKIVSSVDIDISVVIDQFQTAPDEYIDTDFYSFDVTFSVKDIKDVGTDLLIQLSLYTRLDSNEWSMGRFDRTNFYLDTGDTTPVTMNVRHVKNEDTDYKIEIKVYTNHADGTTDITETYEEEIMSWELP